MSDSGKLESVNSVRDRATVRVSAAVSGAPTRKKRAIEAGRNSRVSTRAVPPELLDAARSAMRPGQRMVVVSPTEVRLINKQN